MIWTVRVMHMSIRSSLETALDLPPCLYPTLCILKICKNMDDLRYSRPCITSLMYVHDCSSDRGLSVGTSITSLQYTTELKYMYHWCTDMLLICLIPIQHTYHQSISTILHITLGNFVFRSNTETSVYLWGYNNIIQSCLHVYNSLLR